MRVVFVHGACVKDGSWWWHRTGELLAEQGLASEAPALPSCGETGEPRMRKDPGWPRTSPRCGRVLDRTATSRPSWSPTATAGSSQRRRRRGSRRCAICCSYPATCPRSGRASPRSAGRSPPRSSTSTPRAAPSRSDRTRWWTRSCRTATPEIQAQAVGPDGPAERAVLGQPVEAAAWQHVPSTYLVCAEDRGHPWPLAARVRRPGRQRRRVRRRPPPVPLPARRGPRPAAEPVGRPRRMARPPGHRYQGSHP